VKTISDIVLSACTRCGGVRREIETNYDLGPLLGLDSVVITNMPVIVCSGCDDEMIPGDAIDFIALSLAAFLIARPALDPPEVKFLRKAMGYTQEDLALRLGVERGTVTRWEAGPAVLDGAQSYALRSHALIRLEKSSAKHFAGVFKEARAALEEIPETPAAAHPFKFSFGNGHLSPA